jgi:hypothetical protein
MESEVLSSVISGTLTLAVNVAADATVSAVTETCTPIWLSVVPDHEQSTKPGALGPPPDVEQWSAGVTPSMLNPAGTATLMENLTGVAGGRGPHPASREKEDPTVTVLPALLLSPTQVLVKSHLTLSPADAGTEMRSAPVSTATLRTTTSFRPTVRTATLSIWRHGRL